MTQTDNNDNNNDDLEYQEIIERHKKELEEFEENFQAQITSANPNLRKKLRQRYPKEKTSLEERHYEELLPYKLGNLLGEQEEVVENAPKAQQRESTSDNSLSKEELARQKKREKNRKKADSKKAKEERMRREVEEEFQREGGMTDGQRESQAIMNQLAPLNLTLHEIDPDGHCLYRAVCHQLSCTSNNNSDLDYIKLRKLVAQYMREHKDDFIYFIETDDGNMMDDAQYETYCRKVESSSEWGGQVELRAIANVLQKPIRIFQNAQLIIMGEEFFNENETPLTVSYHRSYYSLGEHYNSVVVKPLVENSEL